MYGVVYGVHQMRGGDLSVDRAWVRFLAWAAILAQLAFIAAWIWAAILEDGYSPLEQGVSELAADSAANPAIVRAGIVVLGLSFIALAIAAPTVLPRRAAAPAVLFASAGLLFGLGGIFTLDCQLEGDPGCEELSEAGLLSSEHYAHLWLGLGADIALLLTPFALALALWPTPVGAAALGAGLFGVGFFALAFALLNVSEDGASGLIQRVGLVVIHLWVFIVAGGVLWEARRRPGEGRLIPIRPRDFFARTWTGEGELVIWPYFIGRRLARRFTAVREVTWLSDRIWRFDDRADYGDGRVQSRRTYCEFIGEDRVRLTAADLPEGAAVRLEEGGYRITPWRMNWPIGPLSAPIQCRDLSWVAPDGTFVNVIEARTIVFGLPLAQTRFYVRPAEREGGAREGAAYRPTGRSSRS